MHCIVVTSSVLLLTVPGAGPVKQDVDGEGQKQSWELKKVSLPSQQRALCRVSLRFQQLLILVFAVGCLSIRVL